MLDILAETPDWIAINKPCGIVVETMPQGFLSVESMVKQYLSTTKKQPFVGVVHRLDRPVSGVLLFAKKKSILKSLNEQFSRRLVEKTYLAWVQTPPAEATQILVHWLLTDNTTRKATIQPPKTPKAALCKLSYTQLNNLMPYIQEEGVGGGVILRVRPETGKFHQIRAQLSAIGCPIVGDEKYGAALPFMPNAIALHAASLLFFDPLSQQKIVLTAPCTFCRPC